MSDQVQIKGGSTSAHSSFTGAERELTVDTDKKAIVVHDGVTIGGFPQAVQQRVDNGTRLYTDAVGSGSIADSYIFEPKDTSFLPDVYEDGLQFTCFIENPNTGVAVTIDLIGLGPTDTRTQDGSIPIAGTISGYTTFAFNDTAGRIDIIPRGEDNIVTLVTLNTVYITATGAYNPSLGTVYIKFTPTAGGGGGGGVDGQGAGTTANGHPGAAGGTLIKETSIIEASYAIAIGAGGIAGPSGSNSGGNGGDTTITSVNVNTTSFGGPGGTGVTGTSGDLGLGNIVLGGSTSGGDIEIIGGPGIQGGVVGGKISSTGQSGQSYWGPGGHRLSLNASNKGSGGGSQIISGVATNFAGGAGAPGIVVAQELINI